ncbi:hypothetical protein ACLK2B_21880 [Escherichia coli]
MEKTGPYNLLFLFSIGIDQSNAMQLLRALTEFKRGYDLNLTIKSILPSLYREDPASTKACGSRSWPRASTI